MTLKDQAISRATALLTAAGAKFKIIAADGTEYGDLQVVDPKARRNKPFAHGERANYIQSRIVGMKPGEETVVPLGKYTYDELNVGAVAGKLWGTGNYITALTKDGKGIEVLRVE